MRVWGIAFQKVLVLVIVRAFEAEPEGLIVGPKQETFSEGRKFKKNFSRSPRRNCLC